MSEPEPFRILAVCSGNVCRSPLAELLLRERFAAGAGFAVSSAGTLARPGEGMTDEMVAIAGRYGVRHADARRHAARRLDERLVREADLVLGLGREHRSAAVQLHPRALRRSFTLGEFARLASAAEPGLTAAQLVAQAAARRGLEREPIGAGDDIEDPIGRPYEVYESVGARIAVAVDAIATALALAVRGPGAASPREDAPVEASAPDLAFGFRLL